MAWIETFPEFAEKHGDYVILDNGMRLFVDGAIWSGNHGQDPYAVGTVSYCELRYEYLLHKLREVRNRHRQVMEFCRSQTEIAAYNAGPEVDEETLDHLEASRRMQRRRPPAMRRSPNCKRYVIPTAPSTATRNAPRRRNAQGNRPPH